MTCLRRNSYIRLWLKLLSLYSVVLANMLRRCDVIQFWIFDSLCVFKQLLEIGLLACVESIIAFVGIVEQLNCVTREVHTKTWTFMSHELKNTTICWNRLPWTCYNWRSFALIDKTVIFLFSYFHISFRFIRKLSSLFDWSNRYKTLSS